MRWWALVAVVGCQRDVDTAPPDDVVPSARIDAPAQGGFHPAGAVRTATGVVSDLKRLVDADGVTSSVQRDPDELVTLWWLGPWDAVQAALPGSAVGADDAVWREAGRSPWAVDGCDEVPDGGDDSGARSCVITLPALPPEDDLFDGAGHDGQWGLALLVRDPAGNLNRAVVPLRELASPPTVAIDPLAAVFEGTPTLLRAEASDAEDANHLERLVAAWQIDDGPSLAGRVGSDGVVTLAEAVDLARGDHTVTVTVTDTSGRVAQDQGVLTVLPPNAPPTCAFAAPTVGAVFVVGDEVVFTGTVADVDAAILDLDVTVELDGAPIPVDVGTDGTWTARATPAPGVHGWVLRVTDPAGAACVRPGSFLVDAANAPPTVVGLEVLPSAARPGELVAVCATVADVDDDPTTLTATFELGPAGARVEVPASDGTVCAWTDALPIGVHPVGLTVADPDGATAVASTTVRITSPPTLGVDSFLPEAPDTRDALVARVTVDDPEGDAVTVTWAVEVDGAVAATDGRTILTPPQVLTIELDPSLSAKGQAVVVAIRGWDGTVEATPVGTPARVVVNAPPSAPTVRIVPEDATDDDDLVCEIVAPAVDPDGDPVDHVIAWTRDGVDATSAARTVARLDDTVPASVTGHGETWVCAVTPDDGEAAGPTAHAELVLDCPRVAWFPDLDGDGWGGASATWACRTPLGAWTTTPGDCADEDPVVHPGADERCDNAIDDDCDGETDLDRVWSGSWTGAELPAAATTGAVRLLTTRPRTVVGDALIVDRGSDFDEVLLRIDGLAAGYDRVSAVVWTDIAMGGVDSGYGVLLGDGVTPVGIDLARRGMDVVRWGIDGDRLLDGLVVLQSFAGVPADVPLTTTLTTDGLATEVLVDDGGAVWQASTVAVATAGGVDVILALRHKGTTYEVRAVSVVVRACVDP